MAADLAKYMFSLATRRLGAGEPLLEPLLLADALLGCLGAVSEDVCRSEE